MRQEILDICVAVLRNGDHPTATVESALREPAQAAALLKLLKDCRPLPVVLDLIAEATRAAQQQDKLHT